MWYDFTEYIICISYNSFTWTIYNFLYITLQIFYIIILITIIGHCYNISIWVIMEEKNNTWGVHSCKVFVIIVIIIDSLIIILLLCSQSLAVILHSNSITSCADSFQVSSIFPSKWHSVTIRKRITWFVISNVRSVIFS